MRIASYINLAGFVGLLFFGVAFTASAAYIQSNSSSGFTEASSISQNFGHGDDSGEISSIQIYLANKDDSIPRYGQVFLYSCTSNPGHFMDASSCTEDEATSTVLTENKTLYTFDFSSYNRAFTSAKWYFIGVQAPRVSNNDPGPFYAWGHHQNDGYVSNIWYCLGTSGSISGTDAYPGCNQAVVDGPNTHATSSLAFYISVGDENASDSTSYISNLSPTNGSTTATTLVNLRFNYHAAALNGITSYEIRLRANNATSSISFNGLASTGDNTVSRSVTLIENQFYTYTAYVCGSNGTCYGGPTNVFSVVSSAAYDEYFSNYYASSTDPNGGSPNIISNGINSLLDSISNKIPFSYFIGIISTFGDLDTANTGTSSPLISLNLHNLSIASSSSVGNFLPDLTVSTTTIMRFLPNSVYVGFLALQGVSFWGAWVWYMYRRVSRFFDRDTA